jgi:hypothetical protein
MSVPRKEGFLPANSRFFEEKLFWQALSIFDFTLNCFDEEIGVFINHWMLHLRHLPTILLRCDRIHLPSSSNSKLKSKKPSPDFINKYRGEHS